MRVALWLQTLTLVLLCAPSVPASPADMFGFGARSQGLAGTGAAHASGYAATYANPARLSYEPQQALVLGMQASEFDLERLRADGSLAEHDDDTQAALIGLALPLPLGEPMADRLAVGLGVSTPGGTIVRVRILDPATPQFPLLGPRAETLNFNLGIGARLPWGLSIGAGGLFIASLVGEIEINAGASGSVSSVTDDELVVVAAPVFGLNWQATSNLDFGLVWRSELRSEFDLQVLVQDLGNIVVPPLNITGLAQADPAQLQAELAYQANSWLFATGVTYKRWSRFDQIKGSTVLCPDEQPNCAAPQAAPIPFEDTLVVRTAFEKALQLSTDATGRLRAGYLYEPSPLQAQTGDSNLFDNDRHGLTVGYGVELLQPWPLAVNIAAQHLWLVKREHTKSNPRASVETSGTIVTYAMDVEVTF